MATEREIIYRLRVLADDQQDRILKSFVAANEEAEKTVRKSKKQSSDEAVKLAKETADQAAKENKRYWASVVKEAEKAAKDQDRILKNTARDEARLLQERSKLAGKLLNDQVREEERAWDQRVKLAGRLLNDQVKEHERSQVLMTKAAERATQGMAAGNRQVREGIYGTAEAAAKLVRGFGLLGLAGEEDTQKILDALLKVQGAFDLVVGGVKLYESLTKAVEGYRAAVLAAASAERLAAASRTGGAGAAASGAAGSLAGGGAAAGGTFLAGGSAATVAAAVAAVASLTAVLWELGEVATGDSQKVGSLVDTIGSWEAKAAAWAHNKSGGWLFPNSSDSANDKAFAGLAQSDTRVASQQRLITRDQANAERARQFIENQANAQDQRESLFNDHAGILRGTKTRAEDRKNLVEGMLHRNEGLLAQASFGMSHGDDASKAQAETAFVNLAKQSATLAADRLGIEREITKEKADQTREAIRGAEQELEKTKERISTERERLTSAKERFGQLSADEQAKAIAAKVKADKFGAASLTREERKNLRAAGADEAIAGARAGDIAEADRAGFDTFFGAGQRKNIGELEGKERKLTLEIADKRKLEVQIQRDEEALVQQLGEFIGQRLAERETVLLRKIEAAAAATEARIAAQTQQQLQQRSQLFQRGGF